MPARLQNLIIFGDSLSDIGIKRETGMGQVARLLDKMRTNEVGRFSDGRNWTDFLVEWAGAEPLIGRNRKLTAERSVRHQTLTDNALLLGTHGPSGPLRYANFATGGAIVADDMESAGLTHVRAQVKSYIAARRELGARWSGPTLHLIWAGLNDIVTAKRPEGLSIAQLGRPFPAEPVGPESGVQIPGRTYGTGPDEVTLIDKYYDEKSTKGIGVVPMASAVFSALKLIETAFANDEDQYFALITLPSPLISVRFMSKIADNPDNETIAQFVALTRQFNEQLKTLAKTGPRRTVIDMNGWLEVVSGRLADFELRNAAQPSAVPVVYLGAEDPMPEYRRFLTTSDDAHPTEAVYQLIARKVVDDLVRDFSLGQINAEWWAAHKPYPKVDA